MSKKIGFDSSAISFTSNDTRAEEFVYARDINATINLDAYEDIFFLEEAAGQALYRSHNRRHTLLPSRF